MAAGRGCGGCKHEPQLTERMVMIDGWGPRKGCANPGHRWLLGKSCRVPSMYPWPAEVKEIPQKTLTLLFFYLWLIWHQVSLCSPGWPWTHSSWQSSYLSLLSGGITHAYASHIVFLQNYSFSDCGRKMLEYQNLGNINEHKEQYALSPGTMSKAFSGYLRLTSHMFTTSPYVCIWVIKLYKRGTIRGRQS